MRHAEVAYFDEGGRPVVPDDVGLTPDGEAQARAAAEALAGIDFDLVLSSGLRRTVETARIVAGVEPEARPELRELRGGPLSSIPDQECRTPSAAGPFSARSSRLRPASTPSTSRRTGSSVP